MDNCPLEGLCVSRWFYVSLQSFPALKSAPPIVPILFQRSNQNYMIKQIQVTITCQKLLAVSR